MAEDVACSRAIAHRIAKSSWLAKLENVRLGQGVSLAGEVEALNTRAIRRLTPSRRHEIPPPISADSIGAVSKRIP